MAGIREKSTNAENLISELGIIHINRHLAGKWKDKERKA